jgi:hypothetical protein
MEMKNLHEMKRTGKDNYDGRTNFTRLSGENNLLSLHLSNENHNGILE